jgi:hypothetical protein
VGQIIADMGFQVDIRRGDRRPRGVSVHQVLDWAGTAGFHGEVHEFERRWHSSPSQELYAITHRIWPALRELDEAGIEAVTRPAIEALRALPETDSVRRATAEAVVLHRG